MMMSTFGKRGTSQSAITSVPYTHYYRPHWRLPLGKMWLKWTGKPLAFSTYFASFLSSRGLSILLWESKISSQVWRRAVRLRVVHVVENLTWATFYSGQHTQGWWPPFCSVSRFGVQAWRFVLKDSIVFCGIKWQKQELISLKWKIYWYHAFQISGLWTSIKSNFHA